MRNTYKKPVFYDLTRESRTFPEDDSFYETDEIRPEVRDALGRVLMAFKTEGVTCH